MPSTSLVAASRTDFRIFSAVGDVLAAAPATLRLEQRHGHVDVRADRRAGIDDLELTSVGAHVPAHQAERRALERVGGLARLAIVGRDAVEGLLVVPAHREQRPNPIASASVSPSPLFTRLPAVPQSATYVSFQYV